ncbi:MAG TPA: class II aldolase/adducin family protein [Candidatus Methanomethylophilaceae archaeon]|nr:class II aldolase/adducin family protein [Candidatus Methanomethylophilaceae archaeon]
MNEIYAREILVQFCRMLYDRGLTVSAGGNMSMMIGDSEILITPSGRNKGILEPNDLVLMGMDGEVISGGKPSIEHRMHIELYNRNNETKAVVHCHPLYCTSLAVKEKTLKTGLTPEGVILLGDVPMIPYYTPGTQELVDAVAANFMSKAMLMARHGAITQGRTIEEAYNRMEELEFQAKLQIITGRARLLPPQEIEELSRM